MGAREGGAVLWATTRRYIETLRALLHGDVVEIDGARTQMLHHADLAPAGRLYTPSGPDMARELRAFAAALA